MWTSFVSTESDMDRVDWGRRVCSNALGLEVGNDVSGLKSHG